MELHDLQDIKRELRAKGITQADVAKAIGLPHESMVSKGFSGTRQFTKDELNGILALLGRAEPVRREIPVIGQVAAGNWREAVQRSITTMPQVDPSIPAHAFGLVVAGDSMNEHVDDGGTVVVDPHDRDLYPGRFYVILNADGEATFKQFRADPARLVPCSTNPAHKAIQIGDSQGFEVVGRVVWRASRM